jgi:signal transduction histidine kinase
VLNTIYRVRSLLLTGAILFLVIGLAFRYLSEVPISAYPQQVEVRLEKAVANMEESLKPVVDKLGNPKVSFDELPMSFDQFSYYVFEDGDLDFWSDYRYVPDYSQVTGEYSLRFIQTLRHDLLVRRWKIQGTNRELFGVMILYSRYKIDNNYIQTGWNDIYFQPDLLQPTVSEDKAIPICIKEECLFSISLAERESYIQTGYSMVSLICLLLVIVFILTAILIHIRTLPTFAGLIWLIGSLLLLRTLMLWVGYPFDSSNIPVFDPRNFASSVINPSLGDLLLNLIATLLVAAYIFRNYRELGLIRWIKGLKKSWAKWMAGTLLAGSMAMTFHFQFLFIQTIYSNSQISYDINETLQFDVLRITGVAIFLVNVIIFFLLFHVLFMMLRALWAGRWIYVVFLLGLMLFAGINLLVDQRFLLVLAVTAGYFLFLTLTGSAYTVSRISYGTFMYLFSALFATSVMGSLATHVFEHKEETTKKARFASQFLIENDLLAEYLLSEARENIKEDIFIQSRMSSPFMPKEIVKSKIRQVHLSNYFDKYDVRIYLYNSNGMPFASDLPQISPDMISSWTDSEYATNYEGIYFINRLQGDITKRYLTLIEVKRRNLLMGYIVIDLQLKKIIPDNVYPELLVDNRFLSPYEHTEYSYAVLDNERITYSSGEFNYYTDFAPSLLEEDVLYDDGLTYSGYDHLALKDRKGRTILISSQEHPAIHLFSNFSFLFLVQVMAVLLLVALYAIFIVTRKVELNYSARIQLYLNGAFFLPLFAVSITTLSVINSSFRKELNTEYYKKAENISENLSDDLNDFVRNPTIDREELPNRLSEVAKYAGVDVNLFSTRGYLLASTQPLIYENGLLSRHINPEAYAQITENNENFYVTRESVGELIFNTTFFGIKSFDTGNLIGIISIPFFQSAYELEQNQIDVLTNVINIFTVIFITFLLISSVVSQWLTFPLKFITKKLKKTTLTGFNEPLSWNSDDEIGLMVREYNRMLVNLEESKKALARNQKESAWREIAQQVAHEIKNPLTPMKLTLQHLSRIISSSGSESEEYQKPIHSLLNQVDILSDIASSFSSFAKLPIPEHERYELTRVIRETVILFRADQRADIRLVLPEKQLYTMGDEQLMGRILSNIMLNAIQSRESGDVNIEIVLQEVGEARLVLEIRDNGSGIEEAIHGKIFMPNFTTKETGSGIGLAVAKHGIEHAGGKIWFETEEGKGTSFFIELTRVP